MKRQKLNRILFGVLLLFTLSINIYIANYYFRVADTFNALGYLFANTIYAIFNIYLVIFFDWIVR